MSCARQRTLPLSVTDDNHNDHSAKYKLYKFHCQIASQTHTDKMKLLLSNWRCFLWWCIQSAMAKSLSCHDCKWQLWLYIFWSYVWFLLLSCPDAYFCCCPDAYFCCIYNKTINSLPLLNLKMFFHMVYSFKLSQLHWVGLIGLELD